jgi:hypothetical protein
MFEQQFRFVFLGSLLFFVFGVPNLPAQYAAPPDAYSISYTESLMMPNQQVTIYRDGNEVITEELTPRSGQMPHATHTRDFMNLTNHKEWTLDLQDTSVPCGISTQGGASGDWSGNPFEWLSGFFGIDLAKMHPPQVGTETVAGRKAQVFEIAGPGGQKAKIWVDAQYGLLLKMSGPGKGGQPETILEVKSFTVGKPAASVFEMPAACAKAEAEERAAEAAAQARVVTTAHHVTAVHLDDAPQYTGACPAKIHFTGTVTADGPGVAWYKISGGFGNHGHEGTVTFDSAGTKSVSADLVVDTDPGPGGGMALLEAAMEDSQGRHGDATLSGNGNFSYDCH